MGAVVVGLVSQADVCGAQITLDGSLGPSGTLTGPNFVIGSGVGQVRGNNLFHSFGRFNVNTGETATFNGPAFIANILSRVTAGEVSTIDGLIDSRSSMPGANFFLINPSGLLVGPNASFNVGGAIHLTSASYIRFDDGARFFASLAPDSVLTVAPPAAFGFLGSTGPISIAGSVLAVDPGQTLSVVGGDNSIVGDGGVVQGVQISGGALLNAPSGRVHVASVASAGEIGVPDAAVSPSTSLGTVGIAAAGLDASGDPGGTVRIRGGQILLDGAAIAANSLGDVDGAAVAVDVHADAALTLINGTAILGQSFGAARGGDIQLSSGTDSTPGLLEIRNGTVIGAFSFGAGPGGDVQISAGQLNIAEGSLVATQAFGEGPAGDVSIAGGTVELAGGSVILTENAGFGTAPGGSVILDVTESVTISGGSLLLSDTASSGAGGPLSVSTPALVMGDGGSILSQTLFADGPGGNIALDIGSLSMSGGSFIASQNSIGAGGSIIVNGTGASTLSDFGTGIVSTSFGTGQPGNISTRFGSLAVVDGAQIQSGSLVGTQGGNVDVAATGDILIARGGGISSQAFLENVGSVAVRARSLTVDGGFINTSTIETGRAGNIAIDVETLSLLNGGQIASSNGFVATGGGGDISVTARSSVSIAGLAPSGESVLPAPFNEFIRDPSSGIFSTASSESPEAGSAGSISVSTPALTMTGGGKISVATFGAGPAGSISIASGAVDIGSGARVDSGTTGSGSGGKITLDATSGRITLNGGGGLFSNATGSGAGGDIDVLGDQLSLLSGGLISASSTGTAEAVAGNISIATSDLRMENSSITTQSLLADGGNITITPTGSVLYMLDSQIVTSVQSGVGGGGNITIGSQLHPFDFIVLSDSGIHADAFGGPGGNVRILAGNLLSDTPIQSAITASSALSTPGIIDIQAEVTDVSGEVTQLPSDIVQAATLLRASCTARLAAGRTSSLVLAGREGVPPEPDGLLSSPLLQELTILGSSPFEDDEQADRFPSWYRVSLDSRCAR